MNKIPFALLALLSGCASAHRRHLCWQDQYMIAREDNGPASSLGAIKAKVFQEAGTFCAGQGKTMEIIRENDVPRSFGQFHETSLQFRCG